MIDLHIHTKYSDGDKTVKEILQMSEDRKLKYISITDHNTCIGYQDKDLIENNIFTGKIIKGTEIYCVIEDKTIELLAYDFDENIMNQFLNEYFSEKRIKIQRQISHDKLLDICDKLGIVYDKANIKILDTRTDIERQIYKEITSHDENIDKLGELAESFKVFYRKGLVNSNSEFYMNYSCFTPKYERVIDAIHEAGGKAFLAHPFEYKIENILDFINNIRKVKELDGIECFHPSADEEKSKILVDYCSQNNLFISGGSDYHGSKKPGVEIGVGEGNLNIPESIIGQWIKN